LTILMVITDEVLLHMLYTFFLYLHGDHRHLHSFPTRRSSDLSARDLVQLVGDAGEADEVFTRRPDLSDADARVTQLGEDRVLDLAGDLASEVRGVAELDGSVVDPEIDRGGGDPVKDDRVPAGALELGAPVASGLRLAEAPGERRLGADAVTPCAGDRRACEDPGCDDEDVVGPQRVRALRHVLQEVMSDEPAPAGVTPEEGV